jgi:hypothetical protein
MIVQSLPEVLKDTGIDRNGEELIVALVRKEAPIHAFVCGVKKQVCGLESSPTPKTAQRLHASNRYVLKSRSTSAEA